MALGHALSGGWEPATIGLLTFAVGFQARGSGVTADPYPVQVLAVIFSLLLAISD
jgi:hypothetical protein